MLGQGDAIARLGRRLGAREGGTGAGISKEDGKGPA